MATSMVAILILSALLCTGVSSLAVGMVVAGRKTS